MINPGDFPFHLDSLRFLHNLTAEAGITLMGILITGVSDIVLFVLSFKVEAGTADIGRTRNIWASRKWSWSDYNTEVKPETRVIYNRSSCIKNTIPRT